VLGEAGAHRELGLGQVHRLLVLICHLVSFPFPGHPRKGAPVPPAGTKRSYYTSLVTTQRADFRLTR
jgi:hypothetical protein